MRGYSPDPEDLGGRVAPAAGPTRRGRPDQGTDQGLAHQARFLRWDGQQVVPDLDADEILEALADDVMAEGDVAEALVWALERGSRSGRVAYQFARDWCGRA